ncbi:hypothetical protein BGZ67_010109, partial [Mortierella alpina]
MSAQSGPATASSAIDIPMMPLYIDTATVSSANASSTGLPSPTPSSPEDFYEARDPMSLESKRMDEDQIQLIQSSKNVKAFYRKQNELITDLLDPPEGREGAQEAEERNQLK